MKEQRIKMTENERIAANALGIDSNYSSINMVEDSIDTLIQKEKANKFNDEVEKYIDEMKEYNESMKQLQDSVGKDPTKLELKPIHEQIIIKPFEHNPFQKMEVSNGIITDTGGFKINVAQNPITGKMEEQEQIILTGLVVEVGPEVKYVQVGDVVFYHRRNRIPIPFFKQGFYNLEERYVLAVVNEGLTERFTKREWINLENIPEILGETVEERIENYKKLENLGLKIVNK